MNTTKHTTIAPKGWTEIEGTDSPDAKRAARNLKAKIARQGKAEAMRSVGLTRVRGAQGGTYWE